MTCSITRTNTPCTHRHVSAWCLTFQSTSAATSIKQSYPQFWDGDANPATLVDNINGVNCKDDASGCWSEIKGYFASNVGEIEKNCQTFYNAAKKDLDLEQSTVRISICNGEVVAAKECGELQTQVEEVKRANPQKACSAFGLGPVSGGTEKPPTCGEGGEFVPEKFSTKALRASRIAEGF